MPPSRPAQALFNTTLGEFLLPYEVVRTAPDPDAMLMSFLQSTYRRPHRPPAGTLRSSAHREFPARRVRSG